MSDSNKSDKILVSKIRLLNYILKKDFILKDTYINALREVNNLKRASPSILNHRPLISVLDLKLKDRINDTLDAQSIRTCILRYLSFRTKQFSHEENFTLEIITSNRYSAIKQLLVQFLFDILVELLDLNVQF